MLCTFFQNAKSYLDLSTLLIQLLITKMFIRIITGDRLFNLWKTRIVLQYSYVHKAANLI